MPTLHHDDAACNAADPPARPPDTPQPTAGGDLAAVTYPAAFGVARAHPAYHALDVIRREAQALLVLMQRFTADHPRSTIREYLAGRGMVNGSLSADYVAAHRAVVAGCWNLHTMLVVLASTSAAPAPDRKGGD